MELKKEEEMIMKLLHFFITKHNYNPVVLHGAKNEIWLENLNSDYKIIRLVSKYIHNDEQMNYDLVKTNQISKSIKKKIFSSKVSVLSIFVNVGDEVNITDFDNIKSISIKKINDIYKNKLVLELFPNIKDSLVYDEKGMILFTKLSNEINLKAKEDSTKMDALFKNDKPIITIGLVIACFAMFFIAFMLGNGINVEILLKLGANNRFYVLTFNEYYRLITSFFLHGDIIHLAFNMYILYIIGGKIENLYGKYKYILILLFSTISGSMLSIIFSNSISVGASGAIFGLLGALVYFGFHYRIYMTTVIKNQIIPLILLNLLLGFMMSGIDNAAHIGGLIGGFLISMACGVKYKSTKSNIVNGIILTIIYTSFLLYLITRI